MVSLLKLPARAGEVSLVRCACPSTTTGVWIPLLFGVTQTPVAPASVTPRPLLASTGVGTHFTDGCTHINLKIFRCPSSFSLHCRWETGFECFLRVQARSCTSLKAPGRLFPFEWTYIIGIILGFALVAGYLFQSCENCVLH